ncbi:MAG: hypothetical protein IIZ38_05090 [Sphingomonas sp.]|uniref:hypothetical protein n=1 Tax=Sphingomonas sp. TaxID=28214 RepID=UPI0025CD3690|nr:hypothetical protein [Sphingomonas sp.]MBQ1497671.1 hypothetical protein [Sphingomonas sp.]
MNAMQEFYMPSSAALKELRAQVSILAKQLDEMIDQSQRVFALPAGIIGKSADACPPNSRRTPASKDVHLLLVLAGDDGITSTEILHELEKRRSVTWSAVRQALNRLRTNGKARRVGRLWYPV